MMTNIYHITSIQNFATILSEGGLWCDRVVVQRQLAHVSIAHQHIKDRRLHKQVPCNPGGSVADYVPFYFAPRSPMLFVIHKGGVEGYQGGQAPILHLVSSVEIVQSNGIPFVFTDGHAEMDISQFYSNPKDLEKIDWEVMQSTYWNDTNEDGDRKRRRQAEFLVQHFFPIELIKMIGVFDHATARMVSGLLQSFENKPGIQVMRAWYY